jgi:hypothetical protein
MLGVLELLILRFGVRMMLCARAAEAPSEISGIAAAVSAAAVRIAIRRLIV